jgi:hypothetical protein
MTFLRISTLSESVNLYNSLAKPKITRPWISFDKQCSTNLGIDSKSIVASFLKGTTNTGNTPTISVTLTDHNLHFIKAGIMALAFIGAHRAIITLRGETFLQQTTAHVICGNW